MKKQNEEENGARPPTRFINIGFAELRLLMTIMLFFVAWSSGLSDRLYDFVFFCSNPRKHLLDLSLHLNEPMEKTNIYQESRRRNCVI